MVAAWLRDSSKDLISCRPTILLSPYRQYVVVHILPPLTACPEQSNFNVNTNKRALHGGVVRASACFSKEDLGGQEGTIQEVQEIREVQVDK